MKNLKLKVIGIVLMFIVLITLAEGWTPFFEGMKEIFVVVIFLALCLLFVVILTMSYKTIVKKYFNN